MSMDACPTCKGRRLGKESLSVKINDRNIIDVTRFSVKEAIFPQRFFRSKAGLPGAPSRMEGGPSSTRAVMDRTEGEYPVVAGSLAHAYSGAQVMDLGGGVSSLMEADDTAQFGHLG